ncbi:DUF1819 family protein [Brevundimonas sp. DC300-4]|uniref:DUF1819 family protein n=1 Tax=Brevundimonas sp. DC300-4 TaxID=2804594 RepID=UPI003CF12044
MSFAVGGLHLNESVEIARLHVPSESWEITLHRALEAGIASLPKAESRRRMLRETVVRVSTLSAEEIDYLVHDADRSEQQALLWLATCRAYRFVREFATEVLRERYLSRRFDLPLESFDILFAAKAEWDERLAGITPATRTKLRQILFRIMREANVVTEDRKIVSTFISLRLRSMIGHHNQHDLMIFPGLQDQGTVS